MILETMRKAIARLEQLQAESTQGEWVRGEVVEGQYDGDLWAVGGKERIIGTFHRVHDNNSNRYVDMELIVALHRTIPALLAILREAEQYLKPAKGVERYIERELALARAILGETE